MEVIPVIDLMGGQVVHARAGDRHAYQPIETPLSRTSAPEDVVGGLLTLHPFPRLYVADLDAILGLGDNRIALNTLAAQFPGVELWVDTGAADAGSATKWLAQGGAHLVVGSESQTDPALLRSLRHDRRVVLSLDFRGEAFLGPGELLDETELWPERVIVMTLARVGAGRGPEFDRVGRIVGRAPGRQIYAAGGVRNSEDVQRLAWFGCAGALVATALHAGRITRADFRSGFC